MIIKRHRRTPLNSKAPCWTPEPIVTLGVTPPKTAHELRQGLKLKCKVQQWLKLKLHMFKPMLLIRFSTPMPASHRTMMRTQSDQRLQVTAIIVTPGH
eukprot:CAMPEP_0115523588 /NCGR_PEP_ID=MMETSP0271-20121206/80712_1 /TAXON_ID=71861 /ORGANISM="Scrippsiella trochoidea, Strain CCMP3099" /LENGTH=97 /DNA_ID=CAMNT_0002955001 /DNA_START=24 /DNA_END=313 /DNA_ORIENTATION=+